jgi:hypothetical protein
MSAISQLKTASFAGISFPYTRASVKLSQRHHVHVYLHTPGGEVEKFGRALYKVSFTVPAHDTLNEPFRNFYANKLPQLWAVLETGATADLVVPNLGTVQAFGEDANRTIGPATSGEPVELSFLEDQKALFALSAVFKPSTDGLVPQLGRFLNASAGLVEQSLIDQLLAGIDELLRLRTEVVVLANVLGAKASGVMYLCERIGRLPSLGIVDNFQALDALLDLHLSIIRIREDATRRARPTSVKVSPATMSIVQLAAWIHRDTARAGELLGLNAFSDPLQIPRGSLVRHYV